MRRLVLLGFLWGLLFPLLGTFAECLRLDALSFTGFAAAQVSTPLLWLLDTAPLAFAGAAYACTRPRQSRSQQPPLPWRDPLLFLVSGLILSAALLLVYALQETTLATSYTEDVNQASSLRYHTLRSYVAARDGDIASLQREQDLVEAIRTDLRRRHPSAIARADAEWGPSGNLSTAAAENRRAVVDRLVADIIAHQRDDTIEARVIFLVSLFTLLAALPVALALVYRVLRAETSARRSEARLAEAQEVAGIGSWEYDVVTDTPLWSREVFRLLEFDQEAGAPDYRTLLSRYHPEDIPLHRRLIRQVLQDGEPFAHDLRAVLHDGSIRWVLAIGRGIKGSDGNVTRLIGTIQDVTARKEAEERIRLSEARLEGAMEATGDGLWEWHVRTGRLTVSQSWLDMLGYTEADFTGDINFATSLCHPDDLAETIAHLKAAADDASPAYRYEHRMRHRDGHWIWVLGRGSIAARDTEGRVTRLIGMNKNITARKQQEMALRESEERFRSAIGAMHEGLVVYNSRGEVVVSNRRAEEILGLASTQMAIPPSPDAQPNTGWQIVHQDGTDWPYDTLPVMTALQQGVPVWDAVMEVRRPNGTRTWLSVNADPLFHDGDSTPRGAVVMLADITARRALEAERELLTRQALERADRDPLTDLLNHRTFHHRLRTETERARALGYTLAVVVMDTDNFKFFNDAYSHLAGDEVLCTIAEVLQRACSPVDAIARLGGDEFAVLLPRPDREAAWNAAEQLREQVQSLTYCPPGEKAPLPLRLSVGVAIFPEETTSPAEVLYMADKRAMQDKTGEMVNSASDELRLALRDSLDGFSMLDALVAAVDNKDRYTRRHSEDVMCLCGLIGREMGQSEEAVRSLEVAALVHDVGKIGCPIRVLRQPIPLSESDLGAIRQHPTLGGILVSAVPELAHTLPAVRHHHERWDGHGYPDGLAGENIPLPARIMAVADAFSAMTSNRPYRVGMTTDAALAILEEGAGRQWDPQCVHAFTTVCRRLTPAQREKVLYRREGSSLTSDNTPTMSEALE